MSVKLECDRCGAQETTGSVMLLAGHCGPGIPTARPELPDGWTRPRLPHEDGSAWDQELCPACTADLFRFMTGLPVIGALLSSRPSAICPGCGHLRHSVRCPDQVSEVGPCGCLDLTPANELKERGIDG